MKKIAIILIGLMLVCFGTMNAAEARTKHYSHHKIHHVHKAKTKAMIVDVAAAPAYVSGADQGSFSSPGGGGGGMFAGGLVGEARRYMGTNPTGRGRLWCGAFMAMIAPSAAKKVSNPNMARAYLELPHVSAQVGAIAVLGRGRRGGHVGVVSGFDPNGNPIIVSGNHGHLVGEGTYPKGRVIAYVAG